ncbi:hypothetical protein TrRE_jg8809, partial [Triparma retinervis]
MCDDSRHLRDTGGSTGRDTGRSTGRDMGGSAGRDMGESGQGHVLDMDK